MASPGLKVATMRDIVPFLAVAGIAIIDLPPLDQVAPLTKSICPPIPLFSLIIRVVPLYI
jgi:hypothetical protein